MGEIASSHLNKIEMHDVDVDESNMISRMLTVTTSKVGLSSATRRGSQVEVGS
jgi:hypothetical protein